MPSRGFSLAELLVVLAVLGFLLALALPSFGAARHQATAAAARSHGGLVSQALATLQGRQAWDFSTTLADIQQRLPPLSAPKVSPQAGLSCQTGQQLANRLGWDTAPQGVGCLVVAQQEQFRVYTWVTGRPQIYINGQ